MKMIHTLFCGAMLAFGIATSAHAELNVKADMKVMAQSLKAADSAKDAASLKKELETLNAASKRLQQQAQNAKPQGEMEKTFLDGINQLIAATDNSEKLADAGKFEEAKASLEKLKTLRNEFHKKMR